MEFQAWFLFIVGLVGVVASHGGQQLATRYFPETVGQNRSIVVLGYGFFLGCLTATAILLWPK